MSKTTQNKVLENIDFKSMAKELNGLEDVSNVMNQMMKKIINEMLKAELEEHLESTPNTSKNGSYSKKVRSDEGNIEIEVPRDTKKQF